ncbi:MAG: esterase/lipase family protein [Solirubrobacteraceae bacterium]
MRSEEVLALGELAQDAVSGVTDQARGMHTAIAQNVFRAIGPAAAPVKVIHDRIAAGAYGAAQEGLEELVHAGSRVLSARRRHDAPSIERSAAGRALVGALNGAFGDTLARRASPLAVPLTIRRRQCDVPSSREGLAQAFPDATPRLAVFVHGLGETDDTWRLGASTRVPYGAALQAQLGYTPLYIRYNSGRHVSENGRELARQLDLVSANWPVELQEIALFGHSMGGLVCRSACHYAVEGGSEWTARVRHVFTLGAPHGGAPLEQAVNVASAALNLIGPTRALAQGLNARSAGIKDLRFGYLLDDDWLDQDPDAFLLNTGNEIPFLAGANHYFVCATLSREPATPIGRIVGDMLVLRSSAWAHGRGAERMRFPVEHYHHVGAANHFDLLNHPAIYEQLRSWLGAPAALAAGGAQRP